MFAVLLLSTFLSAQPATGTELLQRAEAALVEGRWDQVLTSAQAALAQQLPGPERRRALELLASAEAAFGRDAEAVLAFRRLLSLDAAYLPPPDTSPKLLVLFARARSEGPLLEPKAAQPEATRFAAAADPQPHQVAPSLPLLSRWWFWTAVGVLAAGAGAVSWELSRSDVPHGSLGTGALR